MTEKENMIFQILLSLNNGNSGYADERVRLAVKQYDQLIKAFEKDKDGEKT